MDKAAVSKMKSVEMGLPFRTPSVLPVLYDFTKSGERSFYDAQEGVEVTAYGTGRLSAVTYTVPAHGEISLDFTMRLNCVTPEDIRNMSNLIRSLLDASHKSLYDEYSKTDISGGASYFGFFSLGVRASYTQTKHRMEWWGLSEANQVTIVNAMTQIANKTSDYKYTGTVYNRDYDYAVSGNMFAIVMDATIKTATSQFQHRNIAPNPHLKGGNGETLPTLGDLSEV